MEKKELIETLQTLHHELAQPGSVDDEARASLKTLAGDIQQLLDQEQTESAEHVGPLSTRVQDLTLQFETEHPQLTRVLNQVAAALANLGI